MVLREGRKQAQRIERGVSLELSLGWGVLHPLLLWGGMSEASEGLVTFWVLMTFWVLWMCLFYSRKIQSAIFFYLCRFPYVYFNKFFLEVKTPYCRKMTFCTEENKVWRTYVIFPRSDGRTHTHPARVSGRDTATVLRTSQEKRVS